MGDEKEKVRAIMLLDKIPADCDPEYDSKTVDLIKSFARQVEREVWTKAKKKAERLAHCDYAKAHAPFRQAAEEMLVECEQQAKEGA